MNLQESFTTIFDSKQLFDFTPPAFYIGATTLWWYFLIGSLTTLSILLVYSRIKVKKSHVPMQRYLLQIAHFFSYTYFTGLFSLWARRQNIAFFSMPFWVLLMFCLQIGMIAYFVYAWFHEFPVHQEKYLANIERQKYLPKTHKKK